jgi:hypothetical protein
MQKRRQTTYRLVGWRLLRVYALRARHPSCVPEKSRKGADVVAIPLIRRDAATVIDLQALKLRMKRIAGACRRPAAEARRGLFQGQGLAIAADQKSSARIVRRC